MRKIMGRQNERTGSLGCGHLRGLFLYFAMAVRFSSSLLLHHGSPEGLR